MTTRDLELWGGIECTINRVGDHFHSQLRRNGHLDRIEDDLDAFASLGLQALRYPVLWEAVEAPSGERDFSAADRALGWLSTSGMRPIVGLVHHGSGPANTSLLDEAFPARLAEFAADVARRYPWVSDYTPVNEPLTTARFSALYGHWYPHAADDRSFVRALLTEIRATVLAMRAIREVNPAARLVQTDDLGRANGTPPVYEQVFFENERRWLSFDLLCGLVTERHPMHGYLVRAGGADPSELEWFVENPCPPDIIGVNHYPRSDRWLDHRLELFDARFHGGNGTLRYADVAALDTELASNVSWLSLIDEAWLRYRRPIALTEVHIFDTPAEQYRWWDSAVAAASTARAQGVDVRGVTTWALLGSYDWATLCTSPGDDVVYESGAFAVRNGKRWLTPLGEALQRGFAPAAEQMASTG